MTPHKNHGGARCDPQQNHPGDIFRRSFRIHEIRKEHPKKQPPKGRHREGLDQPIYDQSDDQTLWFVPNISDRPKIDLHHHRVNHDPDERRYYQIDPRKLKGGKRRKHLWRGVTQHNAE